MLLETSIQLWYFVPLLLVILFHSTSLPFFRQFTSHLTRVLKAAPLESSRATAVHGLAPAISLASVLADVTQLWEAATQELRAAVVHCGFCAVHWTSFTGFHKLIFHTIIVTINVPVHTLIAQFFTQSYTSA